MKCAVCLVTWAGDADRCPQCGYDHGAAGARSPAAIRQAREAFRHKTLAHDPGARVTGWDKLKPWLALGLGLALFLVWLRACSSAASSLF